MPKATANIVSVSPYHNLPAGDLADQLGALKAEIAALEAREKSLRDELIRRGVSECHGVVRRQHHRRHSMDPQHASRQNRNGAGLV